MQCIYLYSIEFPPPPPPPLTDKYLSNKGISDFTIRKDEAK